MNDVLTKLLELDAKHDELLEKLEVLNSLVDKAFRDWNGAKRNEGEKEVETLSLEAHKAEADKKKKPDRKAKAC